MVENLPNFSFLCRDSIEQRRDRESSSKEGEITAINFHTEVGWHPGPEMHEGLTFSHGGWTLGLRQGCRTYLCHSEDILTSFS